MTWFRGSTVVIGKWLGSKIAQWLEIARPPAKKKGNNNETAS